jgi:hypothetical protein
MAGLTYHKIFPHQKTVLNGLNKALDDPKRVVRKSAAKCRNSWYAVDDTSVP